jgi:hypothetical protein
MDKEKADKMKEGGKAKWGEARKIPGYIWNVLKKSAEVGKIHSVIAFTRKKSVRLISAGIVISLVALAAYRIYKYHISQAGKSCKRFTGPERNNCIRKFKLEGSKKQLDALRAGHSSCGNTSNPEKCKIILSKKIRKIEERISRLSKEV